MSALLEVQLLESGAKAPVVGHAGEDLGYDVFALEDVELHHGIVTTVRTGIAVAAYKELSQGRYGLGMLIRDRSSMASRGIKTSGGVIDAGYRGEIKILMTYWQPTVKFGSLEQPKLVYQIGAGDKIAQMVPLPVLTGEVYVVGSLSETSRGVDGFGSTGK